MTDKNEKNIIWINIILAIVILFFLFGGAGMMGFGGMMGNFSGMMFFGWIFMALIVVALVLFIIWLIKQLQDKK